MQMTQVGPESVGQHADDAREQSFRSLRSITHPVNRQDNFQLSFDQ
jgi:hypothetical protein